MQNLLHNFSLNLLTVDYVLIDKRWNNADLCAPYWRFYWNCEKGASIKSKGQVYDLAPQSIFLIPPNTSFSSEANNPIHHFFCHFTLASPFDDLCSSSVFEFPATKQRLKRIHETIRKKSSGMFFSACDWLEVDTLFFELLGLIPSNSWNRRRYDARVQKAIDIMDSRLKTPLQNEDFAKAASMSTNAFIRLFKQETGASPCRFLQKRRIDRATILLHHTDWKIEQIAEETGFCDRSHFSRNYINETKMGPAQSRKLRRY